MWDAIVSNKEWVFSGIGITVLLGLVGLAKLLFQRAKGAGNPHEVGLRIFPAPRNERYNHEFYNYIAVRLSRARTNIYITGEGFECADDEGEAVARQFTEALRGALRRGARVVRIQTRASAHHKWAEMLAGLLRDFPRTFALHVLRENTVAQMSSVCVIDPEDDDHSTVEIMLSTQKLFGTRAADLAGTAIFIEGSTSLARDLTQRIMSLTTPDNSRHIKTPDEAVATLAGTELYFAFGSNMDAAQMMQRAESANKLSIGFLPDHKLVFNRKGTYRPGGVASVEPSQGRRVYGVIYSVSGADMAALDEAEDPSAYQRVAHEVIGLDGSRHVCQLYQAIPQGSFEPDQQYLQVLIKAAADSGLPAGYVAELKALSRS